jgi:hypothetical protein
MSRSVRWSAGESAAIAAGGRVMRSSTRPRSSTPAGVSIRARTRRSPFRERAHREWAVRVEDAEGVGLGERQAELGELRAAAAPFRHADLEEEVLGLVGGRERRLLSARSSSHEAIILDPPGI